MAEFASEGRANFTASCSDPLFCRRKLQLRFGSKQSPANLARELEDTFHFERVVGSRGFSRVAGIDEVGRGPLAGPVVAAAVILTDAVDADLFNRLTDSKLLTAATREELACQLQSRLAVGDWSIAAVEPAEIDRLNILRATHLAMQKAVTGLSPRPDFCLVDGLPVDGLGPSWAIVKGDRKSASIAAASILAKVYRDSLMSDFENEYPGYDFALHKGYGTARHLQALRQLGPCPIHRHSFAPVAGCWSASSSQIEFDFTDITADDS